MGRPTGTNSSTWPLKGQTVERLSAYRFFDQEVVGFSDGGALHWRNGDVGGKCGGCPPGTKGCQPNSAPVSPTAVRSYAWVYTWPLDPSEPPAPNAPPIKCPNATICGGGTPPLPIPASAGAEAGLGGAVGSGSPLAGVPLLKSLREAGPALEEEVSHWDW